MSNASDTKQGLDSRLFRRIVTYLRPYAPWVAVALALTLVVAYLGPLRPKLIQVAIDEHISEGDVPGLLRIVGILVLVLVGEGVLAFGADYLTQWIGQRGILDLRKDVFRHVLKQPLGFFDKTPVGRLITRATSDVETLAELLSAGVVTIMGDVFRLVFIGYFMFSLDARLALVTLAVMPFMVWATFWFRKKVRVQYRETRKQVARLNSFMQEHVTGMGVVQLFNREKEEARRYRGINDDHRAAQIHTIFYFALFWPMVDIIASVATGLVLWVGGLSAMSGFLTLGTLIAFTQYARQFFQPIRNLSDQYNTLQSALAGAERIFGLLDDDRALPAPADAKNPGAVRGEITFDRVWFSYDELSEEHIQQDAGPNWILRDVSFTVQPGETVAIVGATGAGKSTLMNLLLRFYEVQRGRILVDDVDVRDYDLDDLRQRIGLVLQDVFLFSGTVEHNLTLGNDQVSRERAHEAARLVGADRFIERLPRGYEQDVRERGARLSHGQRQLLSFARALAYDPAILVLDEATSSVDTETEALVQEALEKLMEGRTAIVIAHRLSTIRDADTILVMHKGRLREQGNHAELLAQDGLYRRLYEMQIEEQVRAAA